MAATVTLSSTTLNASCAASDTQVQLTSTTGVVPNTRLWIDRELLAVIDLGIGTWVLVRRGVDGTAAGPHGSMAVVTLGRADQFFQDDPVGLPPSPIQVSPYINVLNGKMWIAQGDETGPNAAGQYWQDVTTVRGVGALGERTVGLSSATVYP
jgi:hypothetical protein